MFKLKEFHSPRKNLKGRTDYFLKDLEARRIVKNRV